MGNYTTGKTTRKRDQCISKKQAEITALKAQLDYWKARYDSQVETNQALLDEIANLKVKKEL